MAQNHHGRAVSLKGPRWQKLEETDDGITSRLQLQAERAQDVQPSLLGDTEEAFWDPYGALPQEAQLLLYLPQLSPEPAPGALR